VSLDPWPLLDAELDLWAAQGRSARLWLRDDDATVPSPALDRLLNLCGRFDVPLLLAVVPAGAGQALARRLEREARILPCQHGFAHQNHAPKGEKAAEIGAHRPLDTMLAELAAGRRMLLDLFADRLRPVLVPPWNRIAPELLPRLPEIGIACVSTFGRQAPGLSDSVPGLNCHVDIIDWKGGRQGHLAQKIVGDLVEALALARESGAPVGILTHHLVHDEGAWLQLETLLSRTQAHDAAQWVSFDDVLQDS